MEFIRFFLPIILLINNFYVCAEKYEVLIGLRQYHGAFGRGGHGHAWVTIRSSKGGKMDYLKEFQLTGEGFKIYDPRAGNLEYYNLQRQHRIKPISFRPGEQQSGKNSELPFEPRVFTRENLSHQQLFEIADKMCLGRAANSLNSNFMCHHFAIQFTLRIVDQEVAERLRGSRHRWPSNINWLEDYFVRLNRRSAFRDSGVNTDGGGQNQETRRPPQRRGKRRRGQTSGRHPDKNRPRGQPQRRRNEQNQNQPPENRPSNRPPNRRRNGQNQPPQNDGPSLPANLNLQQLFIYFLVAFLAFQMLFSR